MLAVAARGIEPGDADAVAFLDVRDAGAHRGDVAHTLVARDEWRCGLDRPVAVGGMQVGVTHAARRDLDEDLAGPGLGTGTSSIAAVA